MAQAGAVLSKLNDLESQGVGERPISWSKGRRRTRNYRGLQRHSDSAPHIRVLVHIGAKVESTAAVLTVAYIILLYKSV